MALLKIFFAGGPIMWPILFCSVLSLAIIIEKLWYLNRIKINTQDFLSRVVGSLKRNRASEAIKLCESINSPLGEILKAGVLKYAKGKEVIKEAMEDTSLYEIPRLEKNLTALATIAHVSPLLGLLGTVTGMVRCFQTIQVKATSFSPVSPGELAGGIWEALLTTVFGLIVAIPTFIFYNYLVSRINSVTLEIERTSTELVNSFGE